MEPTLNNIIKRISFGVRLLIAIAWRKLREKFGGQMSFMDYSSEHGRGWYCVNIGENVVKIEADPAFRDEFNRLKGNKQFKNLKMAETKILKPYEHCWIPNNYVIYYAGSLDAAGNFVEDKLGKATIQHCYEHKDLKAFKRDLRMKRKENKQSNVVAI